MKRDKLWRVVLFAVVLLIALAFILPFVIIVCNSLKELQDIVKAPLSLPTVLHWENYIKVFSYIDVPLVVRNTITICLCSLAGLIVFCSMAAYWCECYPSAFSNLYKKILLVSMLVPFASLMIPLVKVMRTLGLNNTLFGVALTFWGIGQAFAFFIIDSSAQAVPRTIYEAARIDGAGPVTIYFRIAFPLMRSAITTVFLMDLFWIWNDFTVSLILLNNRSLSTIQLAINSLFGAYASKWDVALPALVLTIMPVLVVYIVLQRYIIEGINAGSVKG